MQKNLTTLHDAFIEASSRITPRKAPLLSQTFAPVVLLLSFFIFSMAYFAQGIFAWSAGLA